MAWSARHTIEGETVVSIHICTPETAIPGNMSALYEVFIEYEETYFPPGYDPRDHEN